MTTKFKRRRKPGVCETLMNFNMFIYICFATLFGGKMKVLLVLFVILGIGTNVVLADTCRAGYVTSNIEHDSLIKSFAGGCGTNSGYVPVIIGDEFVYYTSDHVVCGAGTHYDNGTCVNNTTDVCTNGYGNSELNDSLSFMQSIGGTCTTGYQALQTARDISYLTSRGTTVVKCGVGYHDSGNGCVANATDNCPDNYYAVVPDSAYIRSNSDDTCNTNYSAYGDVDLCLLYLGDDMANVCTPQLACTGGGSGLHTSTGIHLPLYDERATTPSLNVMFENGHICFVNMVPGSATNAINVKYNDIIYHMVN